MNTMMLKKWAALLMALAVLVLGGITLPALADITTGTDITTDTDIPGGPVTPPVIPEEQGVLAIVGAESVRGGNKQTYTVTLDGKKISSDLVEWAVFPADNDVCTMYKGVLTTKKVTEIKSVIVTAVLKANGTVYDDIMVHIRPTSSEVEILAPEKTIDIAQGGTLQLSARVLPLDSVPDVTWSSGSTSIATVDENGLVTAKKPGSVTITAKAKDGSGKYDRVTLKVVCSVTGIAITGPVDVAEGSSINLTANIAPEQATNKKVDWSLNCGSSVATISSSGRFSAKKVDSLMQVIVTAASRENPEIYTQFAVTIRPRVDKVVIEAPTNIIDLDSDNPTLQLNAFAEPYDAAQGVKWSCSSSSRATVDENGLVTGKSAGTVTITAKTTDGTGKKATFTVKIVRAVKGIEITGPASVAAGKSISLKAKITPDNATNDDVTWTVDCDKSIATISSSGKLTAKSGVSEITNVLVTAASKENPSIRTMRVVTIRPAVSKVIISAPQTFIDIASDDKTLQLSAACTPLEAGQGVTWSSSSSSRATVNEHGLVTAKKAGSVTITAKATDGSGKSASITIKIVTAAKSIRITGADGVAAGKEIKLSAKVLPENATNESVAWSVDCPDSIATISSSGKLKASKDVTEPVTVTVTATSKENAAVFATHDVTIYPIVKSVDIIASGSIIDLDSQDKTLQLYVAIDPVNAMNDVTWSSSSTSRATVDAYGLVTAKKAGTVTITAKAKDGSGKSDSIKISIVSAVKGLDITGPSDVVGGNSIKLSAVVTPDHATNKNVVWSVNCDASVATISSSGRLYAKKITEATTVVVTATSKENSAINAAHTVTIRPAVGKVSISAPRTWIDVTSDTPTLKLTANCTPDTAGQGVTWSSSRKNVATVNAYGLVTGLKEGTAVITAKANDGTGRYASITIRVIKPITGIAITGGNTVQAGGSLRLRATITPDDATNKRIVWKISCPSDIATVSNGIVYAKNVDTACIVTVTAASEDDPGVKARHQVIIMPKGVVLPPDFPR